MSDASNTDNLHNLHHVAYCGNCKHAILNPQNMTHVICGHRVHHHEMALDDWTDHITLICDLWQPTDPFKKMQANAITLDQSTNTDRAQLEALQTVAHTKQPAPVPLMAAFQALVEYCEDHDADYGIHYHKMLITKKKGKQEKTVLESVYTVQIVQGVRSFERTFAILVEAINAVLADAKGGK